MFRRISLGSADKARSLHFQMLRGIRSYSIQFMALDGRPLAWVLRSSDDWVCLHKRRLCVITTNIGWFYQISFCFGFLIRCIWRHGSLVPVSAASHHSRCLCISLVQIWTEIAGSKNSKLRCRFSTKSLDRRDFRYLDTESGSINHTSG